MDSFCSAVCWGKALSCHCPRLSIGKNLTNAHAGEDGFKIILAWNWQWPSLLFRIAKPGRRRFPGPDWGSLARPSHQFCSHDALGRRGKNSFGLFCMWKDLEYLPKAVEGKSACFGVVSSFCSCFTGGPGQCKLSSRADEQECQLWSAALWLGVGSSLWKQTGKLQSVCSESSIPLKDGEVLLLTWKPELLARKRIVQNIHGTYWMLLGACSLKKKKR